MNKIVLTKLAYFLIKPEKFLHDEIFITFSLHPLLFIILQKSLNIFLIAKAQSFLAVNQRKLIWFTLEKSHHHTHTHINTHTTATGRYSNVCIHLQASYLDKGSCLSWNALHFRTGAEIKEILYIPALFTYAIRITYTILHLQMVCVRYCIKDFLSTN